MNNTWRTIISARELIELVDTFESEVWVAGGVSRRDVAWALSEGRLSEVNPSWTFDGAVHATAHAHAERIAWLITYGWDSNEPLTVKVDARGNVTLEDGNHRLHALAYVDSTEDVLIEVCGYLDVAEEVFDVCVGDEVRR